MKLNISKILFGLTAATLMSISGITQIHAAEPDFIYSGVVGGEINIILPDATYPTSTREWYKDDIPIADLATIGAEDKSEGTTAILKISPLTIGHIGRYKIKDISNPAPAVEPNTAQTAEVHVAEPADITATGTIENVEDQTVGDIFFARNLTLKAGGTSYKNFQTLKFLISGSEHDSITVPEATTNYTVVEPVTEKTMIATVVGIPDTEAPEITSFAVDGGLANKYALQKKIRVQATDNVGFPQRPYYWATNPEDASLLKARVMDGKKSKDISGITWETENTHVVTENGTYTVFVRDRGGNISFKDLVVSKISASTPEILNIKLTKQDDRAYFEVDAIDTDEQPLKYRLNRGEWQTSSKLSGVRDGENEILVSNEAGTTVSAYKTVYLKLFLGKDDNFSEESLYNYIVVSPATWTKDEVRVSLDLPSKYKNKLAAFPYSIDGEKFTTTNSVTTDKQGEIVTFTVKDIYGNVYTAKPYTVKNIDKDIPTIGLIENDGTITAASHDDTSGISKILLTGKGMVDATIRSYSESGVKDDSVTYTATSNGTYKFTVVDFAGNKATASISVNSLAKSDTLNSGAISSSGSGKTTLTPGSYGSGGKSSSGSGSRSGGKSSSDPEAQESEEDLILGNLSNAGHTTMRESSEVNTIGVLRSGASISGNTQMIEKILPDTSSLNTLKKLIWLIPVAVLGAIAVVFVVNRKKK